MNRITILIIAILIPIITLKAQTWSQIGQDIDGEGIDDFSGWSVDLNAEGNIVVIGAPETYSDSLGYVKVFENIDGNWIQIGEDIVGEGSGDESGRSVSINANGNIIAIGAAKNSSNGNWSGHVRIFENISGTWIQMGQDIDGVELYDNFGVSVSLNDDGTIIAAGAPNFNGNGLDSGHVRIFKYMSNLWVQIGEDIVGEVESEECGISVCLNSDGSILAIGSRAKDLIGNKSGNVRIFKNNSGVWTQVGQNIDSEYTNDDFGRCVSMNSEGNIFAAGAPHNNNVNGQSAGHVRVFENISGVWTQIGQDIDGESWGNYSGGSVSINANGTIVAVGATGNWCGNYCAGQVKIYKNISGNWILIGEGICGESTSDESGRSVSINSEGSVVAIGAGGNDGGADKSGHVRNFKAPFVLLIQPEEETSFCKDEIVNISVNGLGINTYCWQVSADAGITWTELFDNETYTGTATDILTIDTDISLNGYLYSCRVSNDVETITSNVSTLSFLEQAEIFLQPQPQENVSTGSEVIFSINVSGNNLLYHWRKNEAYLYNNSNINGAFTNELTISSVSNSNVGTYDCVVTGDCGKIISETAVLSISSGIDNLNENGIFLYPNPTEDIVNIKLTNKAIKRIIISDLSGKLLLEKKPLFKNIEVNLSEFNKGVYIISFHTENKIFTTKIIKI